VTTIGKNDFWWDMRWIVGGYQAGGGVVVWWCSGGVCFGRS
jgi:hypothetical protein